MYFLEQLVAEWYAYQGHFVRTNVKFGPRPKGGYEGEMDIVAFHPVKKELVHTETSMDADSWRERTQKFKRKFDSAARHYDEVFPFSHERIERRVLVGLNRGRPSSFSMHGVIVESIPEFFDRVTKKLSEESPIERVVPEQWPILRAIQMATYWEILKPAKVAE